METISDLDFKREARSKALQTAERMQPYSLTSDAQIGLRGQDKSVTVLLNDAETIYNWLIKDL